MSDVQGVTPARFHELLGDSEWRVTSRGAEALYRGDSFAELAALVPEVVAAAEACGVAPEIDLRPAAIAMPVGFDGDRLPAAVVEFARTVSAAAERFRADPAAIQAVDIFVAEHPEAGTSPFWAALLDYEERGEDMLDPLRRGAQFTVQPIRNDKRGRGRTHIDLFLPPEVARDRVAASLAAGAGSSTTATRPHGGRSRHPTTTASTSPRGSTPGTAPEVSRRRVSRRSVSRRSVSRRSRG